MKRNYCLEKMPKIGDDYGQDYMTGKDLAAITGNKRIARKQLEKIGIVVGEKSHFGYEVTGCQVELTYDEIKNYFSNDPDALTEEDIEGIDNGNLQLCICLDHGNKIATYFFASGSAAYTSNEDDYDGVIDFLLNWN